MQISTPVYGLKRQAKQLARQTGIPLHTALDRVANEEGFQSWSHLSSSATHQSPANAVLARLSPGHLALLAGRPGHGKTALGLELATKAAKLGRKGYFFSLDYHERDIAEQIAGFGGKAILAQQEIAVDTSDDVCAKYVMNQLKGVQSPVLMVIDYLQLLDQKRTNASLEDQITALRSFTLRTGAICVIISQIDRAFELASKPMPGVADIRLPNPIDLSVFDAFFFIHNGKLQVETAH